MTKVRGICRAFMMKDFVLAATSVFRGEVVLEEKRGWHKRSEWEDAQVCLNCTRKRCNGEDYCFRDRKKEMKERAK